MAYPSEETARRNRWEDEYAAQTREHAWQNEARHFQIPEWFEDDEFVPLDIKHAFEE